MRPIRTWSLLVLLLFALTLPLPLPAAEIFPEEIVEKDVPYVPTPPEVVAEMLRMAEVREDDILYDLGCGDGRIVITAAREVGTWGVGVDIDPERIRESRANAEESGVSDRVTFIRGDLFEMNLEEASVLTLYLLPDVNLRLRPKILEELAPGSRIVSHDFDMDDWEPDAVSKIGSHDIFFWIIPAQVPGRWEWSGPDGENYRLYLHQSYQRVTGTLVGPSGQTLPILETTLQGNQFRMLVEDQRADGGAIWYDGRVHGDAIEGTKRPRTGGAVEPWTAQRDPATVTANRDE